MRSEKRSLVEKKSRRWYETALVLQKYLRETRLGLRDQVEQKDRKVCFKTEKIDSCNWGTQIKIVSQSKENKQIPAKDITF